jgi:hypothetical protein
VQSGSYPFKKYLCQSFLEHHQSFEPDQFPWPTLTATDQARLVTPFWGDCLIQCRRSAQVSGLYATQSGDALFQEAIALIHQEELRQAKTLSTLINTYDLSCSANHSAPAIAINPPERMFIRWGYRKSLEALALGGLYQLAQDSHYLPLEFLILLDPLLDEQVRHASFFANWLGYQTAKRQWRWPERQGWVVLGQQQSQFWRLLESFNRSERDGNLPDPPTPVAQFMGQWNLSQFLGAAQRNFQTRLDALNLSFAKAQTVTPGEFPLQQPNFYLRLFQTLQSGLKFWPQREIQP